MEVISSAERKARKDHVCDFCLCKIKKGVVYKDDTCVNNGEIYNWRSHLECKEVLNYIPVDDDGDGIDSMQFDSALDQWFYDNEIEYFEINSSSTNKEKVDYILEKTRKGE